MLETKYYIKNPSGKRRSFALVAYTESNNQRSYIKDFKEPRVDVINAQLKSGKLEFGAARTLMEEVRDSLIKKSQGKRVALRYSNLSAENQKLFDKFWDAKYAERILQDERSAKCDFIRALKLIGTTSLYTGSAKDITTQLKVQCESAAQHRRAADRLNEMLKFLNRGFKLAKPGEDFRTIQYLTAEEVKRLAKHAPTEELKHLVLTLFGTGARLGEAMAIGPRDVINGIVNINKQITPANKLKGPKRGKEGRVPVISFCEESVILWSQVANKNRLREKVYDFIVHTAFKLWPQDSRKHISPHDLRHSYAIHLLGKDVSLKKVADSLRNRTEVCEKYYLGYSHTDESLEAVKRLI